MQCRSFALKASIYWIFLLQQLPAIESTFITTAAASSSRTTARFQCGPPQVATSCCRYLSAAIIFRNECSGPISATRKAHDAEPKGQERHDVLGVCPDEISKEIKLVAQELWNANGDDGISIPIQSSSSNLLVEGESQIVGDGDDESKVPLFSGRADYFRKKGLVEGCPKAQHSYGLLLWSGFGGVQKNPIESAKFHAAAASQNHVDGMAVLGGCLRTGTGVPKQDIISLGLKLIDYCASIGNPAGINKKAALLESNDDYRGAVKLYEDCVFNGRENALLLFNLGWCCVNGLGVDKKNRERGIELWIEACSLAPDEGSEEAAWYLYKEFERDNPKEAMKWYNLSKELGYEI